MSTICIYILSLLYCVQFSTSQYASVTRRQSKAHCENPTKNTLIENFFNIIFSEFYSTPPVCVCVQMCAGQSTYCYPNGCLKTATTDNKANTDITKMIDAPSQIHKNKNQFLLLKDDKFDFMADFLRRNYGDELKSAPQIINTPVQEIRPDPFKDKYNMLRKYKKMPKIELRYNINEKMKNMKSDFAKNEGVDLTQTRWPLNKSNRANAHKLLLDVEKPLFSNSNFFKTILPEKNIGENPPKYFKRDLAKAKDGDKVDLKSFYLLENALDGIDAKTFSLEKLIDTLIQNTFNTNTETLNYNETEQDAVDDNTKVQTVNVNSNFTNESTNIISMNFTNENIDKNKYIDENLMNKTDNVNEMITYLAKQIEKQNNTSMEIAKNIVSSIDESTIIALNKEVVTSTSTITYKDYNLDDTGFTSDIQATESADCHNASTTLPTNSKTIQPDTTPFYLEQTTTLDIRPTKKNRQRVVRKLLPKPQKN